MGGIDAANIRHPTRDRISFCESGISGEKSLIPGVETEFILAGSWDNRPSKSLN